MALFSLSAAKWLAPGIFLADLIAQIYGLSTSPSMVDVHFANMSFFSPNTTFVAVGFSPMQVLQLIWLYKLVVSGRTSGGDEVPEEVVYVLDFVPYFVFCHLCLIAWVFYWNSSRIALSLLPIGMNALAQLYFAFNQHRSAGDGRLSMGSLTRYISSAFAGMGIIDVLHVGSVTLFKDEAPGVVVKVATPVLFTLASCFGDSVLGVSLTFGLLAFAAGQDGQWRILLNIYAAGTGAVMAVKGWLS